MSTGQYLLVLLLSFGISANEPSIPHLSQQLSVCTATADAGPDQAVCSPGANVTLMGSFTGNVISQEWSPATGLSDPFSLTPTVFVSATTTYTLTVFENTPQGSNLVINGDFSAGNVGFSTGYTFVADIPGVQTELFPEGTYNVGPNPNALHTDFSPCPDHSGGGGNMMIVNGSAALQSVWCQTVAVTPNTAYNFSAWLASVHPSSPAQLQFSINGIPIGNVANASSATCNWIPFNALWNSGGASSAEICIINLNTQPSGNDFAIDDIFFTEICQATDEVTVFVIDVEAIISAPAEFDCNSAVSCQVLDGSASMMGPGVTYLWTTVDGVISSGVNTATALVCAPGTYELTVSQTLNGVTCTDIASVEVLANNIPPPAPVITGNTAPCANQLETYCIEENDAYETYFWALPDGGTIIAGQGTNCVIVDWSALAGGVGQVCVIVENFCGIPNTDCIFVLVQEEPFDNIISGDTLVCEGLATYEVLFYDPVTASTIWSIPGDATLVSGQGGQTISIDWTGSLGGEVCVETAQICGTTNVCIAVQVLPQDTTLVNASICLGDSLLLGGVYQNSEGVFVDYFPRAMGCDSLVITALTVFPVDSIYLFLNSCNPLDTGWMVNTFVNDLGCDSTVLIYTELFPSDTIYYTLPSCDSLAVGMDTLINQGPLCPQVEITTTYYAGSDPVYTVEESCFPADTGLVTIVHLNVNGCDSTEFIQTILLPSSQKDSTQFTCNLNEAGIDTFLLFNQNLCDSLLIITTDFIASDTISQTDTTCNPMEVGVDIVRTPIPGGCFLIEIITTIFLEPTASNTIRETCDPAEVGTVLVTHPLPNGCDSLEFVNTILLPSSQKDSMDFTCNLNEAGIDTLVLVNQNMCDSFLIITTTFVDSDTIYRTNTTCNPMEVGVDTVMIPVPGGCFLLEIITTVFSEPTPTNTLKETCDPAEVGSIFVVHPLPNGCDSFEFVNTILVPSSQKDSMDFTCNLNEAGLDTLVLVNQNGCDSLLIINTAFVSSDTLYRTETTCNANEVGMDTLSILIPGGCFQVEIITTIFNTHPIVFTMAESCFPADTGLVIITHQDQNGCDSLEYFQTNLLESSQIDSLAFTCSINEAGVDTSFYFNQNGCNSLLIINTQYIGSDTIYAQIPSCDSTLLGFDTMSTMIPGGCFLVEIRETYFLGIDPVFTTGESCLPVDTGLIVIVHQSQEGCDSIEYQQVDLVPAIITSFDTPTCFLDSVRVDTFTFVTPAGCDSLRIRNTYFVPSDTAYLSVPTCDFNEVGLTITSDPIPGGCFQVNYLDRYFVGSNPFFTTATSCNPLDTGLQIIIHTNQFGCDSIENRQVTLLPSNINFQTDFTCDLSQSGVDTFPFLNQFGCDSLVILTTQFIDNDTLYATAETCDQTLAGMDTAVTVIIGGCLLLEITETLFLGSPPFNTFATSCNPLDTGLQVINHLNQHGCDSIEFLQTNLLPSSIEFFSATTCDAAAVGVDTLFENNQFGCDSLLITNTTLLDINLCSLDASVTGDDITCLETEGALILEVLLGEAPFNYQWDGPGTNPLGSGTIDDKNEILIINGLGAGDYSITITSSGGLVNIYTVTITQEEPVIGEAAITSTFGGYAIACPGEDNGAARAEVISGGSAPYTYEWSNGALSQEAEGLEAGKYLVSIYDSQGCLAIDSVDLREPAPLELDLVFSNPLCFGFSDGFVEVAVLQGGIPPYVFSLNGGVFQETGLFTNLSSGVFEIEVMDENGCRTKEIFTMNMPAPIVVDLGEDISLDLGDSTQLNAVSNIPFEVLDSINWSDDLCAACTDPFVYPLVTSAYSVRIEDANGCSAADDVRIYVRKDRAIYWPNGFSPNGDNVNETFFPFAGSGVQRIVQMEIYSRWGEEVFEQTDFLPNNPAQGWDGQFRGEFMNPGVFVWWAQVEFVDGEIVLFSGDLTLVR